MVLLCMVFWWIFTSKATWRDVGQKKLIHWNISRTRTDFGGKGKAIFIVLNWLLIKLWKNLWFDLWFLVISIFVNNSGFTLTSLVDIFFSVGNFRSAASQWERSCCMWTAGASITGVCSSDQIPRSISSI